MEPEKSIETEHSRNNLEELVRYFEENRGCSQLVILQGTPDPDAISSAMGLEFIANQFEITTTFLCFSHVSHHENRALVKRLSINLINYAEDLDLRNFRFYSIVDSQKSKTAIDKQLKAAGVEFLAFIDHHREEASSIEAKIIDVRPTVQSTATILCEYIHQLYPEGLLSGNDEHVRLATALMHGIRTDTQRFTTATRHEYQAAQYLASAVDTKSILLIERKVLAPSILSILEQGLVNHSVHDNFIFSHVGFVRTIDRDGIPQAAELLLTREGTDTVLVFGIVDEKTIDGSFRTSSEFINPDEFLKGVLGTSPSDGRFYGGGNIQDRGGFQIPLGFFSLYDDKEQVYNMAREVIERSFLDYIGKAQNNNSKKDRKEKAGPPAQS